jgi:hypothetical protein
MPVIMKSLRMQGMAMMLFPALLCVVNPANADDQQA